MAHVHVCLNQLVIPWENKILGDFPKYVSLQKRSMPLCSNDAKYSYNTRNIAQNFMFAGFKKKIKILGFKPWAELCRWRWMLEVGASKVFPTHPAAGWAYLTVFMGYAAHETALMTQFSHFSDHLQPPLKVPLPRSAGLWFLVKQHSQVIKRKQEKCQWAIPDWGWRGGSDQGHEPGVGSWSQQAQMLLLKQPSSWNTDFPQWLSWLRLTHTKSFSVVNSRSTKHFRLLVLCGQELVLCSHQWAEQPGYPKRFQTKGLDLPIVEGWTLLNRALDSMVLECVQKQSQDNLPQSTARSFDETL